MVNNAQRELVGSVLAAILHQAGDDLREHANQFGRDSTSELMRWAAERLQNQASTIAVDLMRPLTMFPHFGKGRESHG